MLLIKKILVFFSITLIKFIRLTLTLNKVNRSHSQRTFCEETRCALQTSGIWKKLTTKGLSTLHNVVSQFLAENLLV